MIWIRLFAFSVLVVFRSCEIYNVKKSINGDSSRVYGVMDDAKNREAMIGKVLESYVKPFKRLSANFPSHDVEIQLEFQRPQNNQQASKLVPKRPIYARKRPKMHTLHERVHSGVDYLADRNANEHYSVPSRNAMEYLPYDNIAGNNIMDNLVSRSAINNYGARKVINGFGRYNGIENLGNHNGMVNFGGRTGLSDLTGLNTVDNFGSRNAMGNNIGYNANNNFADHNAVDSFMGHHAINMNNYPGDYPMNKGVGNVMGQETVQVVHKIPALGAGAPLVGRQAETESTTTEVTSTTNNVSKGPSLSLEDIRQLFDEYAEKIISSKSGNEQQKLENDQVPQIYIQDSDGKIDDSMLTNLDQIANLIKKGVQVYKVDENNQENPLPKMGLNWMRIKVPVR